MRQVTSAALTIEDEVLDYLLPLFEFRVSAMSLGESREFNPFVEFTQLFPATTPNESSATKKSASGASEAPDAL